MRRARIASVLVVVATAIGFATAASKLTFTAAITEFLPDGGQRDAQVAALLAQSEVARVMIIDVSLGTQLAAPDRLHAFASSLLEFLRGRPEVAHARSGMAEHDIAATLEFLHAWPATTFIPATDYSDDAIRRRLVELRDQLAGPMSMLVRPTAQRDPLGGMWQLLRGLRASQNGTIVDDDGIMVTADRRHAFAFVETKASPFDSEAQRTFRAGLDTWMARSAPPGAQMQTAGAAQFAIASETQIKRDVNRIGIVSTVGILALFLLLFGSLRMIAVGFVPMLFGSAIAALFCQAWFGHIHGITIAFGTSLVGIGLDYTEHYFAHFVLTPTTPAGVTMKQVAPSIALGALTTVIGFVGIAASGVAGLRQMAAFSAIAIIASLAATYWLVPPWMPASYRPPRTLGIVHRGVLALLQRLTRRSWSWAVRVLVVAATGSAIIIGLRAITFSDDVNILMDGSAAPVRDDRAVRSRLAPEAGAFAVMTAPTDDALMTAVGKATAELERARVAGDVAWFLPLGMMIPSAAEQIARREAARGHVAQLRDIMTELGFVPDQFRAFWDDLAATSPRSLTLGDLRNSPVAPLVSSSLPSSPTADPVALIPIVGVHDLPALRARVPSASIIQPATSIVELFRSVRGSTIAASLLGFAAIALLLLARYRSLRKVTIALAPALLACAATVATLAAVGIALTILHVMALLLVVSLGVDFGIFFVDSAATPQESARTMVSILTASATTLLSFGLLSASDSPGLAALGITVTLGVTYSLGFCFVMASLAGQRSLSSAVAP